MVSLTMKLIEIVDSIFNIKLEILILP